MPLWKLVPVVPTDDDRWLDYTPWREVLVRAPSPAMARVVASRSLQRSPDLAGNESPSARTGLEDEKLYHVLPARPEDARGADSEGPEEVIAADPAEDEPTG